MISENAFIVFGGDDWMAINQRNVHASTIWTGVWACPADQPERIITGSFDESVKVWQANETHGTLWDLRYDLTGHTGGVMSIAVSPDQTTFATCSADSIVRIWRVADGRLLRNMKNNHLTSRDAWCLHYSPDGRNIVCGNKDSSVKIYSAETGERIQTIYTKGGCVNSVKTSPDGKYIACAGTISLSLYDVQEQKVVQEIREYNSPVTDIAFSPDSKMLLAAYDEGQVELYHLGTTIVTNLRRNTTVSMSSVDFSSDGRWCCATSEDATTIWDAVMREHRRCIWYHNTVVYDSRFHPDSTRILTVSADQCFRIFEFDLFHRP